MTPIPTPLFPGKVAEVRNAPTTIQNVVTYDVVVKVANPELKLKPGMTANVSIITALEKDVLKVPNAAIRFKWQPAGAESEKGSAKGASGAGRCKGRVVANAAKTQGVWVLDGQKPRRAPLTLGINDGNNTAVLSGETQGGGCGDHRGDGTGEKGRFANRRSEVLLMGVERMDIRIAGLGNAGTG